MLSFQANTHTHQEDEKMSKKRKGLDEVVESLIDVVYNGKITENEDGTYAVLEDPVQSTSRIISADRMEAKSPMQQDEDEEDPIRIDYVFTTICYESSTNFLPLFCYDSSTKKVTIFPLYGNESSTIQR